MKRKKHLIIIVAITMVAAVVSVQLCGCFSIAEFKKLFEDSGPRGLYSAGVAQDYFKLHTEALDAAADWFKANPNVVYVIKASYATGCHFTGPIALRHRLSSALPIIFYYSFHKEVIL